MPGQSGGARLDRSTYSLERRSVPIRFELAAEDDAALAFAASPLLEAC